MQILSSTSWNVATVPVSVAQVEPNINTVDKKQKAKPEPGTSTVKKQKAKPQADMATASLENGLNQLSLSVSDIFVAVKVLN